MLQMNVVEAKRDFSKLLRLVESQKEDVIRVSRNGEPVVDIVAVKKTPVSKRIGVGKGRFKAPKDFDANNEEVYKILSGGSSL